MSAPVSTDSIPQGQSNKAKDIKAPTFMQTAGKVTQLFFAGLAALGGVASFCVGIAFTPFSQESGIAAFTIGTSLFGLAGALLFNALKSHPAPDLSSRTVNSP